MEIKGIKDTVMNSKFTGYTVNVGPFGFNFAEGSS